MAKGKVPILTFNRVEGESWGLWRRRSADCVVPCKREYSEDCDGCAFYIEMVGSVESVQRLSRGSQLRGRGTSGMCNHLAVSGFPPGESDIICYLSSISNNIYYLY